MKTKNSTMEKLDELMLPVRRHTSHSEKAKCIKNFEDLIKEINDPRITNVFISELGWFLTDLFELFHEVDKLRNLDLKNKILTKEFIRPEKYFLKSKKIANKLMRIRAAIEYNESAKHKLSEITKDANRKAIRISWKEASDLTRELLDWYNGGDCNCIEFKETARKTMLLYHYIPAIIKALIQTKRRSLGLDCNSKKFG